MRENMVVGENNIIFEPLVGRDNIILPLLHIKLRLMRQFIKFLHHNSLCFIYISIKPPGQLINDPNLVQYINLIERKSWIEFLLVIKNILGNSKLKITLD